MDLMYKIINNVNSRIRQVNNGNSNLHLINFIMKSLKKKI